METVVDSATSISQLKLEQLDEPLTVKVDSQVLTSMNFCPESYRLRHIEHWRPIRKAAPLEKGSVMHEMLKHYRRGKRMGRTDLANHGILVQECLTIGKVAAANAFEMDAEDTEKELTTFREYVLKWQYDGWEVLDVEEPFSRLLYEDHVPIVYGDKIYTGLTIIYEGIIDARVRDPRAGVLVVDSKTESRRSYPFVLNNQFQGYEWAWGVPVCVDSIGFQVSLEATDEEPDQYGRDKSKFRRAISQSDGDCIDEWKSDTIEQVKIAIGWHRDLEAGIRTSLQKNRTSCDKWSGCDFQRVCQVPVESRESKLIAFYYRDKPWDVYERDADKDSVDSEAS
jgi:hypothetical protein